MAVSVILLQNSSHRSRIDNTFVEPSVRLLRRVRYAIEKMSSA